MGYYPFGATTYTLASSISSTATTITLSSFIEPVTGTPYTMALLNTDIVFATIAPKTTSSEFISFTGITQNSNGTATLTGVTRGLAKKYPFTTDSAYKLPHPGQSQFIISDAPQVFVEYAAKENDETITGNWTIDGQFTFNTFPITPSNSPATTSTLGVVKTSVAPASPSSPIAVETTDPRVPIAYAVDSVGTDAYAITPSPAITAYTAGQQFTFKAGTANTGAATLNVNGLGAKSIKKNVSIDLNTGDILANQIVTVVYDGTNMQFVSNPAPLIPTTQTFSASATSKGDTTTQFDITNTGGSTYRYTYDTTGTDPNITALTMPIGMPITIQSTSMTAANTGSFIVTGSGNNYFEVANVSGVAENNKTLAGGYLKIAAIQTYTKPSGLSYAVIEVQAGGGAGAGGGPSGGGGAYLKKILAASSIGTTETVYVGTGGVNSTSLSRLSGIGSAFGSSLLCREGQGGGYGDASNGTVAQGGIATGGDINIKGGSGSALFGGSTNIGGMGGGSFLGFGGGSIARGTSTGGVLNGIDATGYGAGGGGGAQGSSGTASGGNGGDGIVRITEYYS